MFITKERLLEIIREELTNHSLKQQDLVVESDGEGPDDEEDQKTDYSADYAIMGAQGAHYVGKKAATSAAIRGAATKIAPLALRAAPFALRGLALVLGGPVAFAVGFAPMSIRWASETNKNPRIRPASEGKLISNMMKMATATRAVYNQHASTNFKDFSSKDALDVVKYMSQLIGFMAQAKKVNNRELPPTVHFRSLRNKFRKLATELRKREAQGAIAKKDGATPKKAKKTKKVARKPKATRRVKNTTAGSVEKSELRKQLRVAFREMKKAAKDAGKDNWRKLRYSHPKRVAVRNIYKQLRA